MQFLLFLAMQMRRTIVGQKVVIMNVFRALFLVFCECCKLSLSLNGVFAKVSVVRARNVTLMTNLNTGTVPQLWPTHYLAELNLQDTRVVCILRVVENLPDHQLVCRIFPYS